MPELPEVETVKEALKRNIIGKKIVSVDIYYNGIIKNVDEETFKLSLINETIVDIKRIGKYLVFIFEKHIMLSHLRMEGKYNYLNNDPITPHDHVVFHFEGGENLKYNDTRKFGTMDVFETTDLEYLKTQAPLNKLGIEPLTDELTFNYLKDKISKLRKPIKTVLLDQSIISGLGNIYADEVCIMARIHPLRLCNTLNDDDIKNIVKYTNVVIEKAIKLGGTTIRSFTSSHMITGRFQNELIIHTKDNCGICGSKVKKIFVGGRGTYYCENCQKEV